MNDLIEQHRKKPWPPLIVAGHRARLIFWRDAVLTVLMWALFLWLLEEEIVHLAGPWLERWGFLDFEPRIDFATAVEWMRPYIRTSVILVVLLAVAGFLTLRRRRRDLALPAPPPLTIAEEAARAGRGMTRGARAVTSVLRSGDVPHLHRFRPRLAEAPRGAARAR